MPRNSHGHLVPGHVSAMRRVPADIPRPEYVGRAEPRRYDGDDTYSPERVEAIRRAGHVAAGAIQAAGAAAVPGVTTDELDAIAHEYLIAHGAYPSTLGYRGFPKSSCTSLNEVVCHGIPDDTVLEDGDILNIDVTAYLDGVHGDSNVTFLVGEPGPEARALVDATRESLARGIRAVAPGRRINVVGRAIESYAKRGGYGVVRDFTGHGVGEAFHSGLIVPHYDAAPQHDAEIVENMVFTIEPMLTLGGIAWDLWDDDWTVTTRDKSWSAQFEHTLVVTERGADVLTAL
jgi:methionyl aminopeptidase